MYVINVGCKSHVLLIDSIMNPIIEDMLEYT